MDSKVLSIFFLFLLLLPLSYKQGYTHVGIVVHVQEISPELALKLIEELKYVRAVQLTFFMVDNTTEQMENCLSLINQWLMKFKDYEVYVQITYNFEKYGYWECPNWKYNTTASFSQEFYNEWYSRLATLLNFYDNVKVFVGFNEPFWHFSTTKLAKEIIVREYTTWKTFSKVPFSVEFPQPYEWWARERNFPVNASFTLDCIPCWQNYSDFVGVNLWADDSPPASVQDPEGHNRTVETLELLKQVSRTVGKPIYVDEFPAWRVETFKYVCDVVFDGHHRGNVYRLWYPNGYGNSADGEIYGIFNIDTRMQEITRVHPTYYVFNKVLNQTLVKDNRR